MKFSLVLGTINRTEELEGFLASLAQQIYQNFELVVVDQNVDKRLYPVLEQYRDYFSIVHLYSEPGLSKARNIGLKYTTGDIIAFPDDDCEYPQDLLIRVQKFFLANPGWDGLCGRAVDHKGRTSMGRFDSLSGTVGYLNVWRRGISFTLFLKRRVTEVVGLFDEGLGIGAKKPFHSGEETDYLIRAIKSDFRIYYDPKITVRHPNPIKGYNNKVIRRGYFYGKGMGRVWRKHNYPLLFVMANLTRPLGGALISLFSANWSKFKYHYAMFKGRLKGWLSSLD